MTAVDPTPDPAAPTAPPRRERSRRDVLCGLVVALTAPGALVAACGDEESGSANGSGGPTPLADIPDGGGLIVDNPTGGKALLVRNGQKVTAYNASCTHMGTIVGVPKKGVSTCPNHGSRFNVAQGGAVVNGPATKPLQKLAVRVQGDQVVLA